LAWIVLPRKKSAVVECFDYSTSQERLLGLKPDQRCHRRGFGTPVKLALMTSLYSPSPSYGNSRAVPIQPVEAGRSSEVRELRHTFQTGLSE
jgi:hypothetical protein